MERKKSLWVFRLLACTCENISPNFRFSGRSPSFRQSHEVPLVKSTLVDNTGPKWRFNSRSCLYSESKTAKSSLRGPDIESCIIRKPRDSSGPLAFPPVSANILLCRSDRRLFRICTLARPPRQWTLQIFIFWAWSPRGPLNLVKSDNESDRTPVLTSELRGPDVVLDPWSFPAHRSALAVLFRRRKI